MSKKNQTYDEFIEKFKLKKTTDDCYTPPLVYEAVFGWAREHLEDLRLVRKTWHSMFFYFYSMNLFLNKFCIFAVENKTLHVRIRI